jgi:predicted DNA-binding protein with PD1-like motif
MEPGQIFLTRADQNCDVFNIVNENFQQQEMENNWLTCI